MPNLTPWMCRRCEASNLVGNNIQDQPGAELTRCPSCHRPSVLSHPELHDLGIAHIDCDAFYAAVEKRDNPALAARPVIIGGETRGVVATCCYLARIKGVRSAMPMFQALKLCKDAVVIKPNMRKYAEAGQALRQRMFDLSPAVQPLSIDEAFIDLKGTRSLHGRSPALVLRDFQRDIEASMGISVSVGLSYNKLMAKIASDLDKPRGFSVLGRVDGPAFLAEQPLSILWGVGKASLAKMQAQGLYRVGDLLGFEEEELMARYGVWGQRLYAFARGQDSRSVQEERKTKSISKEITLEKNLADFDALSQQLWPLCEQISTALKAKNWSAFTVTLKLKTAEFHLLTRSQTLSDPTASASRLYAVSSAALGVVLGAELAKPQQRWFRLIGLGVSNFADLAQADPMDLADPEGARKIRIEKALDQVKAKLGPTTPIVRGKSLK